MGVCLNSSHGVAPRAGAWIETFDRPPIPARRPGRPSRRGVDRNTLRLIIFPCDTVAPRAGAWIETLGSPHFQPFRCVAPRAGAWIETKSHQAISLGGHVAPRAGAWIETVGATGAWRASTRRPSRRGVDRNVIGRRAFTSGARSPLAQGRGSKLYEARVIVNFCGRPSRRGVDRNSFEAF